MPGSSQVQSLAEQKEPPHALLPVVPADLSRLVRMFWARPGPDNHLHYTGAHDNLRDAHNHLRDAHNHLRDTHSHHDSNPYAIYAIEKPRAWWVEGSNQSGRGRSGSIPRASPVSPAAPRIAARCPRGT